jgi:hypothetical protein
MVQLGLRADALLVMDGQRYGFTSLNHVTLLTSFTVHIFDNESLVWYGSRLAKRLYLQYRLGGSGGRTALQGGFESCRGGLSYWGLTMSFFGGEALSLLFLFSLISSTTPLHCVLFNYM